MSSDEADDVVVYTRKLTADDLIIGGILDALTASGIENGVLPVGSNKLAILTEHYYIELSDDHISVYGRCVVQVRASDGTTGYSPYKKRISPTVMAYRIDLNDPNYEQALLKIVSAPPKP